MLHISLRSYLTETRHAITLTMIFGGIFKAAVYGIIIAVAGCMRGFQCGNSSSAVGEAATEAVVTGIVYVNRRMRNLRIRLQHPGNLSA